MEYQELSDEIRVIKQTIEKSRRRFADNGLHYIVWGVLTAVACVLTYLFLAKPAYVGAIWAITYIDGIAFSAIIISKKKRLGASNFLDKVVGSVWLATLVALIFLLAVATFSPYISVHIFPIFPSIMLAVAYFITGCVYEDNLLKWVAFCWLAAAIALSFWISALSLLVFAGFLILLQVVPGILIYQRSKNGQV